MYCRKLILALLVSFVGGVSYADLPFERRWGSYSADEKAALLDGEIFSEAVRSPVEGGWPQAGAWAVIPGVTPKESMAVFFDYEDQQEYLNRVHTSLILRPRNKEPSIEMHVLYRLKKELGISVDYAVKDTVRRRRHSRDERQDQYLMSWELSDVVTTRFVRAVSGYARFEALIEDGELIGTYITYFNWIVPTYTPPGVDETEKALEIVDVVRALRERVQFVQGNRSMSEKREWQLQRLDAVPFP